MGVEHLIKRILKRIGVNTDSNSFADIKQEHDYAPATYQTDKEHQEGTVTPTDGVGIAVAKPEENTEEGKKVYITLDGDDVGSQVEEGLMTDEVEPAITISDSIHKAHAMIKEEVEKAGGKVLVDGGDNMIITMPFDGEPIAS